MQVVQNDSLVMGCKIRSVNYIHLITKWSSILVFKIWVSVEISKQENQNHDNN